MSLSSHKLRSASIGNPRYATTFRDEGFNGELADMARASHRIHLEAALLTRAALRDAGVVPAAKRRRRIS